MIDKILGESLYTATWILVIVWIIVGILVIIDCVIDMVFPEQLEILTDEDGRLMSVNSPGRSYILSARDYMDIEDETAVIGDRVYNWKEDLDGSNRTVR